MCEIRTGRLGFFFFSSRRRHTRLVSDWSSDVCSSDLRLAGQWRELGHYLRLGCPRREGRHDVLEPVRTLPGHLLPELGEAHEFFGQRDVAAEEHREPPLARRAEHLGDLAGDLGAVGQLARYAGLHVVDQQRHTPRVANVLQRTRYPRPEDAVLHRTSYPEVADRTRWTFSPVAPRPARLLTPRARTSNSTFQNLSQRVSVNVIHIA